MSKKIKAVAGLTLTGFAMAAALSMAAGTAQARPTITEVPGKPVLDLAAYDLKALGYEVDEFFLSGKALSYKAAGPTGADGRWAAAAGPSAPYVTRVVVVRPEPARFNGTVVMEWLNVSGGRDAAPDWLYLHRELLRAGYAYIGVSAQKVGIDGGPALTPGEFLKKADPKRYGSLDHPGDAFAFDVFSQAGIAARGGRVLGPLKPKRVLAVGESQSAIFLTTYVNAIDPLAKVYDGFLIHSRFGGAPSVEGARVLGAASDTALPDAVRLRADLRVPVVTLISETDLVGGGGLGGFFAARQPDNDKLRVWEIAGAAHADNYVLGAGALDSGQAPIEALAAAWKPTESILGAKIVEKLMNAAPQHHYVAMAALAGLDRWVRTGEAPPKAEPLQTSGAAPPTLALDANGNALGGVRTPWVDVPTAKLSGLGNSGGPFGFLLGTTEPFDAATLARLYPGGKADYLQAFDAALAKAIGAGFILKADEAEIRALAAALYPAS